MSEFPPDAATSKESDKKRRAFGLKGIAAAIALTSLAPESVPHHQTEHAVSEGRYSERDGEARELETAGITAVQRARGYKPGISESLARGLSPFRYSYEGEIGDVRQEPVADVLRMMKGLGVGIIRDENQLTRAAVVGQIRELYQLPEEAAQHFFDSRMDAFHMYLGLPQEHGTFGVSEFRPANGSDDMFYYRINRFVEDFAATHTAFEEGHFGDEQFRRLMTEQEAMRMLVHNARPENQPYDPEWPSVDSGSGVMGAYTLTKGEDEHGHYISYFDRWDLGGSLEGEGGRVGAPFEIYDRIYYDPEALGLSSSLDIHVSGQE